MRLEEKFLLLKEKNKKALVVYIPFGFPSIEYTNKIILTLQECDVDVIELGIPFSDPIADGPIIQEATTIAIKNGANIKKLFFEFEKIKNKVSIPIVLMSYYNPIFRFGIKKFFDKMKNLGISGILTVDLAVDEDKTYIKEAQSRNLETVFLVTPTTTLNRAKEILKYTRGFLYYVSVTGITGPKKLNIEPIKAHINNLRKLTNLPICVGFGIHKSSQIQKILEFSDGVVVGSCIVQFIKNNFKRKKFFNELKNYIKFLSKPLCIR